MSPTCHNAAYFIASKFMDGCEKQRQKAWWAVQRRMARPEQVVEQDCAIQENA
jgi:hypothetical protein